MKTIYERIIPLAEAEKDRVAKELSLHKKQYELEVEKLYHLLVRYESFLKAQDEIGIVELTSSQYRERARDVVKQEIERQQLYVTQSKNRYERTQEALERTLIEEKKFSRLQENHTVETKRIEALTEQNQLDELALLQFGRGRMI
ncbi:flagellar FliJ family protein [Exiguobacterium sp. BRG2]|uniref:flagellar export protein FliJ n=1 Tax=unclassified Exiguobacterium TaxID=2644629 RepID=UPI002880D7B9|nr:MULTISPECIES: flagellar FliJ family protein [unclassified Exiguobacterium]MDT0172021.1 flagellar FliJ family protein [Exiguobacterium sp. BRG2]